MERRRLLTAGLVVAAGLAGCNTTDPDEESTATATDGPTPTPTSTRTPTPDPAEAPTADELDGYRFDIVGRASPEGPHVEEIDVAFEPAANAVVVSSAIVVGSSRCSRVGLESLLYGEETLQAAIAPKPEGEMAAYEPRNTYVGCTDDVIAEEYSLRATFDGGLPEMVVVREPGGFGEDEDRVREVEQ